MTKEITLTDVTIGDRIKLTQLITGTVAAVDHVGLKVTWKEGASASTVIERLVLPKPQVGERITGQRVRDTAWKRGTIIEWEGFLSSPKLVLSGKGHWLNLDNNTLVTFDKGIAPRDIFKVVHVA